MDVITSQPKEAICVKFAGSLHGLILIAAKPVTQGLQKKSNRVGNIGDRRLPLERKLYPIS